MSDDDFADARLPTSRRRSTASNRAVHAATLVPLALGIAANVAGRPFGTTASVSGAPSATAPSVTSATTAAATRNIPRIDLNSPASEILDTWEKPVPNKSRSGNCGWFGSEGADKETNHRKNRTDLPSQYHTIEFSALTDLDWPREATTRRDRWSGDQLEVIAPYEGEALTVTGFIVALRPQANSTEATNCSAKGEDNTDWHIALVGDFGDPESEAVVVETTPRIKKYHPNWDPKALKALVGKPDSVRVSGYLLFDPVHKGHLKKYRKTLWEIHPIHRIEYWRAGRWIDVDDALP